MFCTNCGEKLEGQAVFCTGCGQRLDRDAAALPPSHSTGMFESPKAAVPTTEAPLALPPRPSAPLPGSSPMNAAAPQARAAKPGNSKLFLWMGILLVLLAVVGGLAYVAFRQFVQRSAPTVAEIEQSIADADGSLETSAIPEELAPPPEKLVPEEPAPAPEPAAAPPAAEPPAAPRAETPAAKSITPKATPPPAPKPTSDRPSPPALAASAPPVQTAPQKTVEPVAVQTPSAPAPAPEKTEPPSPPPAPKGSKVMLSGGDAYSPPPAPKASAPAIAPKAPPAPTSGDVFWNGTLKKNQTVTVDFSSGDATVGGQPLPGKPVRLETFSPVVEIVELPGPENGWKRFSFRATRDAKKSVTLNFHWSVAQ